MNTGRTPLAFDFTNGLHDTGNAMATSIGTGVITLAPIALDLADLAAAPGRTVEERRHRELVSDLSAREGLLGH